MLTLNLWTVRFYAIHLIEMPSVSLTTAGVVRVLVWTALNLSSPLEMDCTALHCTALFGDGKPHQTENIPT